MCCLRMWNLLSIRTFSTFDVPVIRLVSFCSEHSLQLCWVFVAGVNVLGRLFLHMIKFICFFLPNSTNVISCNRLGPPMKYGFWFLQLSTFLFCPPVNVGSKTSLSCTLSIYGWKRSRHVLELNAFVPFGLTDSKCKLGTLPLLFYQNISDSKSAHCDMQGLWLKLD